MLLLTVLFCICGQWLFAAKTAVVYGIIFGVGQFLLMLPFSVAASFGVKFLMISRFVSVSAFFIMLQKSTSISQIIQTLEFWRVSRKLTVPLSVMFRFAPTMRQEMAHIGDSMTMRGIRPTLWGFLKAPAPMLEYVLLPLLMRSIKVSEELAASAVVRGIENPEPRTVRLPLRWKTRDSLYVILVVLIHAAVIVLDKGVI